jgi:hypothetical protein
VEFVERSIGAESMTENKSDDPVIVGWGRTSKHIELEAFGDKFTVQKASDGKWKVYNTPKSLDEIEAEHAAQSRDRE